MQGDQWHTHTRQTLAPPRHVIGSVLAHAPVRPHGHSALTHDAAQAADATSWQNLPWEKLGVRAWRERVLSLPGTGAREGLRAAIARIEALNPVYNAISTLCIQRAMQEATAADEASTQPDFQPGPLHGVPMLIKDEIDVAGTPTTFGTNANPSPKTSDSLIITRLRRAGAIIVGKTIMPAFGAFPFTDSQAFGSTLNPWDTSRSPGGSSGGSAVAVACGMVPAALGGDGGGSIRIPSAHCGTTGFKPARGSVPSAPYKDLWLSLGTAGPIARTVEDCCLVFEVISAQLANDARASQGVQGTLDGDEPRTLSIGLHTRPASPGVRVHKEHHEAVDRTVQCLRAAGHQVKAVHLRHPDPTVAFMAQFYGGIREEIAGLEFPERIEPRHKRTALLGAWVRPSVARWAVRWSRRFASIMDEQLHGLDALLTPAVAARPARAGAYMYTGSLRSQLASLSSVAFAAQWNVSGHPALVLPTRLGSDGLPIGIQLVGPRGDADLLKVGEIVENVLRKEAPAP